MRLIDELEDIYRYELSSSGGQTYLKSIRHYFKQQGKVVCETTTKSSDDVWVCSLTLIPSGKVLKMKMLRSHQIKVPLVSRLLASTPACFLFTQTELRRMFDQNDLGSGVLMATDSNGDPGVVVFTQSTRDKIIGMRQTDWRHLDLYKQHLVDHMATLVSPTPGSPGTYSLS